MEVAKKSSYSCCNLQKCTEEKFWIFVSFSVVVHAQKLSEKWKSQYIQSPKTVFEPISKQKRWCLLCLSEKSWESMTLDTIMFVSQATKRCPERERGSRKKKGTNRTKKKYVFFGDSASHFERSLNQGQWRVLMDHLLFMVCTNNKLLFIACDEATQKEEDCYESWELIWGIFPAALAPVLRLYGFTNYFFTLKKEYSSR